MRLFGLDPEIGTFSRLGSALVCGCLRVLPCHPCHPRPVPDCIDGPWLLSSDHGSRVPSRLRMRLLAGAASIYSTGAAGSQAIPVGPPPASSSLPVVMLASTRWCGGKTRKGIHLRLPGLGFEAYGVTEERRIADPLFDQVHVGSQGEGAGMAEAADCRGQHPPVDVGGSQFRPGVGLYVEVRGEDNERQKRSAVSFHTRKRLFHANSVAIP